MKKHLLCLAAVALSTIGFAQAQTAGSIVVRLGGTSVMPQVESGDLTAPSLAGTKVDIKNASQVTGGVTYFFSENLAIDVPVGVGFKHDVVGDGAIANVGKLGTVKALPVTVMGQYYFGTASSTFRPYVGAGLTYARFFKPKATAVLSGLTGGSPSNPTLLTMKSVAGPTVALGLSVKLGGRWTADGVVSKVFLKTTGTLSTGQTIETTLDPLAVSLAIGYTF
ncbi:outer membrane protein OmpW [soil metagenome]